MIDKREPDGKDQANGKEVNRWKSSTEHAVSQWFCQLERIFHVAAAIRSK
jgi:hypothetical protein